MPSDATFVFVIRNRNASTVLASGLNSRWFISLLNTGEINVSRNGTNIYSFPGSGSLIVVKFSGSTCEVFLDGTSAGSQTIVGDSEFLDFVLGGNPDFMESAASNIEINFFGYYPGITSSSFDQDLNKWAYELINIPTTNRSSTLNPSFPNGNLGWEVALYAEEGVLGDNGSLLTSEGVVATWLNSGSRPANGVRLGATDNPRFIPNQIPFGSGGDKLNVIFFDNAVGYIYVGELTEPPGPSGSVTNFAWSQLSAASSDIYYPHKSLTNLMSDYLSYINLNCMDHESEEFARVYIPEVTGDTLRIAYNVIDVGAIPDASLVGTYGIISPSGPYASWTRDVTNTDFLGTVLEVDFTPLADPSPDGYYYAWQHYFDSNQAFYFGLQTRVASVSGNPKGCIFSIWGANSGSVTVPGGHSGAFSGEGTGWQTLIPYSWVVDKTYRFRLVKDNSTTWSCYVKDLETNIETHIGTIGSPTITGTIGVTAWSWVERYSGITLNACSDIPYGAFLMSVVTSDWRVSNTYYDMNSYCRNSVSQAQNDNTEVYLAMGQDSSAANVEYQVNGGDFTSINYNNNESKHYISTIQPDWTVGEEAFISIYVQKPTDPTVFIEIESVIVGDSSDLGDQNESNDLESAYSFIGSFL